MLKVAAAPDTIQVGDRLRLSFHRTLRVPEDGSDYPLPPGLGRLPIVPVGSAGDQTLVVPLYRREALWIGFSGAAWKPNAVKVIAGGVNAVSGLSDSGDALGEPQDYLVCPDQPWLDGFNAGNGLICQFVAMPLGEGYSIESAYGHPERGGLRFKVFEPVPGRFPESPPPAVPSGPQRLRGLGGLGEAERMGLSAGGRMRQKLYPDRYGRETWDCANTGSVTVEIVDALSFRELTGLDPPETPIDAETYATHGLPWFELYDDAAGSVAPGEGARVKTVASRDAELGLPSGDQPVAIGSETVRTIHRPMPDRKSLDRDEPAAKPRS